MDTVQPQSTDEAAAPQPVKVKRDYGRERFERLRAARGRLAERIGGIFENSERGHWPLKNTHNRLHLLRETADWAMLPRHDRSYLEGIIDSREREWNRRGMLEVKHLLDGHLVTSEQVPVGRWHEVVIGSGGTYWKGTEDLYL